MSSSQSFYRKWRSQSFADVVGQTHVTRTLRNALNMGRIAHAYLLCGPRGVGKTSVARILAKAINCLQPQDGEPCNDCPMCLAITEGRALDVIEIDAASNRRIEEMRDLRDKVNFAPTEAKYKVYILDEAHMLTNEASNALLKTLEEPPPRTVFVMVTTEAHRLPETIVSRCQRFNFRRISSQESVGRLGMVCTQEGLTVSPETLALVARAATGSLRDAEGLLDQLVAYCGKEITLGQVQEILGLSGEATIRQLVEAVVTADLAAGLVLVNEAAEGGADLRRLCDDVVGYFRAMLLLKSGAGIGVLSDLGADAIEAMRAYADRIDLVHLAAVIRIFGEVEQGVRGGSAPQLALELAVTDAILRIQRAAEAAVAPEVAHPASSRLSLGSIGKPPEQQQRPPTTPPAPVPRAAEPAAATPSGSVADRPQPVAPPAPPRRAATESPAAIAGGIARPESEPTGQELVKQPPAKEARLKATAADLPALLDTLRRQWKKEIIEGAFAANKPVQALLRSCDPYQVRANQIVIGCDSKFHQGALGEGQSRRAVEKAIGDLLGTQVPLLFDVVPRERRGQPPLATSDPLVKEVLAWGGRIKNVVSGADAPMDAEQPPSEASSLGTDAGRSHTEGDQGPLVDNK